jgi:DNA-directed RNA polymerase subunit N (RpoN/RPB10)
MGQHSILMKRQGALALRKLASWSPELKEVLLDAGAEEVLRETGTHRGCLDEAYAALRDLGLQYKCCRSSRMETRWNVRACLGTANPTFSPSLSQAKHWMRKLEHAL